MKNNVIVREARPEDCVRILEMMRGLAQFEGYKKNFVVTEDALYSGLFEQRKFEVLVACCDGRLVGLLTYYFLPFTYDLSPWIYIKELYVDANFRARGIGRLLMNEIIAVCQKNGGTRIRWDVLSDNDAAKSFYLSLGACHDHQWELFSLKITTHI